MFTSMTIRPDTLILFLAMALFSTCAPNKAQTETDSYGYNEHGQYEAWSSSAPNSNRYNQTDREAYREYSNRETLRQNQETIDGYYSRQRTGAAPTPAWEDNFTVHRPNGSIVVCQRGPNGYVFCR